jgi:hypothetical protein
MSKIPFPQTPARRWATAAAAAAVVGAGAVGVHLAEANATPVAANTTTVQDGSAIQLLPANGDLSGASGSVPQSGPMGQDGARMGPPPDRQSGTQTDTQTGVRSGRQGAASGSGGFQQAQPPGRGTGAGQAMTQGS